MCNLLFLKHYFKTIRYNFTCRWRVAIFTWKKIAPLHFTGLMIVFKERQRQVALRSFIKSFQTGSYRPAAICDSALIPPLTRKIDVSPRLPSIFLSIGLKSWSMVVKLPLNVFPGHRPQAFRDIGILFWNLIPFSF